jgi:hypothetical protein
LIALSGTAVAKTLAPKNGKLEVIVGKFVSVALPPPTYSSRSINAYGNSRQFFQKLVLGVGVPISITGLSVAVGQSVAQQ